MSKGFIEGFQGDVLFIRKDKLPTGLKKKALQHKDGKSGYILAYGEQTGHTHFLEAVDGLEAWEAEDGTIWLKTAEVRAPMQHEEHGVVAPCDDAIYKIGFPQEYDYWQEISRRSAD